MAETGNGAQRFEGRLNRRRLARRTIRHVLALVPAILVACGPGETPPPAPSTLFVTDSETYTLQPGAIGYEALINVEFTNRLADTVYFMNCNGVTGAGFQKLSDSTWRLAWTPAMNACASEPIAVAPGATHTFPTHAFAARRDRVQAGEFSIDSAPGTYRIVWPHTVMSHRSGPPFADSLPLAQRVTNSFALLAPERP